MWNIMKYDLNFKKYVFNKYGCYGCINQFWFESSCCCRDRLFATSDLQFHLAAHFRWADGYLHLLEMTKLLAIDLSSVRHPNFSIFSIWSVCGVKDKDVRWYETGPDYNCWYHLYTFIYFYKNLYTFISKHYETALPQPLRSDRSP